MNKGLKEQGNNGFVFSERTTLELADIVASCNWHKGQTEGIRKAIRHLDSLSGEAFSKRRDEEAKSLRKAADLLINILKETEDYYQNFCVEKERTAQHELETRIDE